MNPIIKLSDNAANRIKEIMSSAEKDALGVKSFCKIRWLCRHVLCHGIFKRIKS